MHRKDIISLNYQLTNQLINQLTSKQQGNPLAEKFHINHLAVIGVGLIGGSLIRALRRAGCVGHVSGYARTRASLDSALSLGVIDEASNDVAATVRNADIVVVATPLETSAEIFAAMRDALKPEAIVTDAGSVKGSVIQAAREMLTPKQFSRFVPGHPVAGTEKSGVEASFAELFDAHRVILTPVDATDKDALKQIELMWQRAGAEIIHLPAQQHDAILAATSHLPHMLAYALVDCLAGMNEHEDIFRFAAGGFADFSRIASSSPRMWHDICFANRDELLAVMERFQIQLQALTEAIRDDDRAAVIEMFTRAKTARDRFNDLRLAGRTVGGRDGDTTE